MSHFIWLPFFFFCFEQIVTTHNTSILNIMQNIQLNHFGAITIHYTPVTLSFEQCCLFLYIDNFRSITFQFHSRLMSTKHLTTNAYIHHHALKHIRPHIRTRALAPTQTLLMMQTRTHISMRQTGRGQSIEAKLHWIYCKIVNKLNVWWMQIGTSINHWLSHTH